MEHGTVGVRLAQARSGTDYGSAWLAKVRFGPAMILARPLYEMDANGKDGGEREVDILTINCQ